MEKIKNKNDISTDIDSDKSISNALNFNQNIKNPKSNEIIEKPEDGSSGSNTLSKSIENNIKSIRESNHNNPLLIKKRNLKIQC